MDVFFLVLAVALGIIIGGGLYMWQRPKLTKPYLVGTVVASTWAIYYILNVLFGSGRTGWP